MNDKLYILLQNKVDFFEPHIFGEFNEKKEIEKALTQIEYITDIVSSITNVLKGNKL